MNTIAERLHHVRAEIAAACGRVGRSPDEVTLVAVTKTHPPETVLEAIQAGARDLGENRVYEGIEKMQAVREMTGAPARWHMIGNIQSRKTQDVAEWYDMVHSVERVKIARRLSDAAEERGERLPALLEVNVSGEESKSGWRAWPLKEDDAFHRDLQTILAFPGVEIRGLMTMAPIVADPEQARPYFVRLRQLRDELAAAYPSAEWAELSMGMSSDFVVAVEEGATIVRVGRAIFGPRE